MCIRDSIRRAGARRGFSLLELMMVVGVISILLGFLLPALKAVTRHSRRVAARQEARMLEGAWQQYYTTYGRWPGAGLPEDESISGVVADMLQGLLEDDPNGWNPKRLRFVDFSRFLDEGKHIPVNPWCEPEGCYFVRFDTDFDNLIPNPDPAATNRIARSVIVWTLDPTRAPDENGRIIGSWQE